MHESERLLDIEKVRAEEHHCIDLGRDAVVQPRSDQLVGLALSGGAIRSATFNLGVLRALAHHELLHRIDCLSTVSGGGYVGSMLSAWIYRQQQNLSKITKELKARNPDVDGDVEAAEVTFAQSSGPAARVVTSYGRKAADGCGRPGGRFRFYCISTAPVGCAI